MHARQGYGPVPVENSNPGNIDDVVLQEQGWQHAAICAFRGTRRLWLTLALSHIGISSDWWRKSFAMLGAITVGSSAWARLSIETAPAT